MSRILKSIVAFVFGKSGLFCLALLCLPLGLSAQVLPEEARQELRDRGIDEEELKKRMLERGIDLDQVDPTDVFELQRIEPILQEVIREMEAENARENDTLREGDADQDFGAQGMATEDEPITVPVDTQITELTDQPLDLPGTELYGQHIFQTQGLELYTATKSVKPPPTYVLGPGDEVSISIFGASQQDLRHTIDSEGYITPSRLPRISLKGLKLSEAEKLLASRFSNYYRFREGEFVVALATARTITVNIFGEVHRSGSYTISAINTAFNALVAAGGPSDIGSVRSIQIIRNGDRKTLDIYAFLNDPSVQFDYYLQEGDIIFVPVLEKVVKLQGEIRRPYKYELKESEHLRDLLEYAGGLTEKAYPEDILIQRILGTELTLLEANLDAVTDFAMRNGDVVTVKAIPEDLRQFVEIEGPVKFPGQYAMQDGLTVSDILQKSMLRPEARIEDAFVIRQKNTGTNTILRFNLQAAISNPKGSEDLVLEPQDRILISSQNLFTDTAPIRSEGSLRAPSSFTFDPVERLNISDLVLLSGGLAPDASPFGYILRNSLESPTETEYIRVDLNQALAAPEGPEDIELSAGDVLRIPKRSDFIENFPVVVNGAVRRPGEIQYHESLTLQDVLTLSGGLTFSAASNRVDIFRLEINENEPTRTLVSTIAITPEFEADGVDLSLQPFDQIVVRNVPGFEMMKTVYLEGEVLYPGAYPLLSDNERMSSIIKRAGGLTDEAFPEGALLYRGEDSIGLVISNLDQALAKPNSRADMLMKQGDVFEIPKILDMLTIETRGTQAAAVYDERFIADASLSLSYQGQQSARWYINEFAGGFAKNANRRTVSVEYPNGRIAGTKRIGPFKKYPKVLAGSKIKLKLKVPKIEREEGETRKPFDWERFSAQVIGGATGILTLVLLAQQLNKKPD